MTIKRSFKNQVIWKLFVGSDSSPDVDEMNFEEKTSCFLPPTVATKIGLAEVKVVSRTKVREKVEASLKKDPEQQFQDLNGF